MRKNYQRGDCRHTSILTDKRREPPLKSGRNFPSRGFTGVEGVF